MLQSELMVLSILVAASAVAVVVQALRKSPQGFLRPREKATETCLVLLNLIQDLQRHRALSGAILDGRKEFQAEREAIELKLQRALYAVSDQYRGRHAIFRQPSWRIMLGHWEALHRNWQGLDFFTSVTAHGNVIAEMFAILATLAEGFRGALGEQRARVLQDWPIVIEHLGMLRALGLHRLARVDDADEDQLGTLVTSRLRMARHALDNVCAEDLDSLLLLRTRRAFERVEWLMEGNAERYHPYTFYEEMTGVIDDWYAALRGDLQVGLEQRVWWDRVRTVKRAPAQMS